MNRRRIVKKDSCLKRVVYGVWYGGDKMSPNRKKCYDNLVENFKNEGLEFKLITEKNICEYPLIKLHEGFQYLSEVHKSDYLRTALMHFYGGGYTDIKMYSPGWKKAFSDLENSNSFGNGYTELSGRDVAVIPDKMLHYQMVQNFSKLLGNVNYIFKKDTPFTREWYSSMIKLMDKHLEMLKRYPSKHSRQNLYIQDRNYPYPIQWTELLGCIFHPLCLKYSEKLIHTCPKFKKEDYL